MSHPGSEKKQNVIRARGPWTKALAFLLCFFICFLSGTFLTAETSHAAMLKIYEPFVFDREVVYRINEDGTAVLVMSGKDITSVMVKEVIIAGGEGYTVTEVANGAFANRTELSSVTMPNSVKTIGDRAFFGCVSLENVKADGVESVGADAFTGAPFICDDEFEILGSVLLRYNGSSEVVKVPAGVSYISDAFSYNMSAVTVIVPEGVTSVGEGAFAMAQSLKNVSLPFSLEKIGNSAFFGCVSLETVSICSNVRAIGTDAFSGTPYMAALTGVGGDFLILGDGVLVKYLGADTDVTVPRGVKYVSDAFAYNGQVESVTLPESLVDLGEGAFEGATALRRVIFEGETRTVGDRAFAKCSSLRCVVFDKDAPSSVGNKAFTGLSPAFAVYYREGSAGFEIFDEMHILAFGS